MSKYFSIGQTTITDSTIADISKHYDSGYVFTRLGKGIMNRTRSLRINLEKFKDSSENRRVLRLTTDLAIQTTPLPLSLENYDYSIQKLAKDFYANKFGVKLFSANKVKDLLTDQEKSNFNTLLKFTINFNSFGYCIAYSNEELLHYCYPFYNYIQYQNNYGISMMIKSINKAKEEGKEYFYMGSATRPSDKYKLDFLGLEWFDTEKLVWSEDIGKIKKLIQLQTQNNYV